MADKDAKAPITAPDEPAPAAPKKKKPLLLIIIAAGVVVLGAVGWFVVKPMLSADPSAETAPAGTDKAEAGSGHGEPKKENTGGHGESEKSAAGGLAYAIEDIIVNPAGTSGTRFLMVSCSFDLASQDLVTAFETRESVIRDALITILSAKSVDQLTDPKQKEIMRLQIRKRLSQVLRTDGIAGVYFTDFVLQ